MQKIQTTYTFKNENNAKRFRAWLILNQADRDYGYPKFLNMRPVGQGEFCVEYVMESQLIRGVAIGCDL